ncbi:MAG: AAA family ATPase [Elusimicrobia bacterium]|nr:AAA family ATPase [Elusimicrobiota bacterium]
MRTNREEVSLLLTRDKFIKREDSGQCEAYLKGPNILLISGLRRAGKSSFAMSLTQRNKSALLNFDDERLISLSTDDLNTVLQVFLELYPGFEFMIFDEIQNVKGWELFLNRMRRNKYKIIVTGSNANLLSREMATHLTGRYNDHVLFPMSFREFLYRYFC